MNVLFTDYEKSETIPSSPYHSNIFGQSGHIRGNPVYRKRTNASQPMFGNRRFGLGSFMKNFNGYLKEQQLSKGDDITSNPEKREGNDDIKPIQGITSSKMRALQEKLDPQLKEDIMDAAIDVMRRNREKPQYNTGELKKIAALLDKIR